MASKTVSKTQVKTLKKQAIRNEEYYGILPIFDELYSQSQKGRNFTNLIEIIESEENILLAYRNLKRNKGSKTPGVDGKTIKDLQKLPKNELVRIVRNQLNNYQPKPVKRVMIPKPGGDKMRPLGIPCILDRLVQQAVKQVMEPIAEAKFYKHSYGFRPDRSVEHAIARCYSLMQKTQLHYVVDVDIKGFFDNVNHKKLRRQLWSMGFQDKHLLSLINKMLRAPIQMEDGTKVIPNKGTPQGGVLSPLLANICLNELDWWIASQWEHFPAKRVKDRNRGDGYIDRGNKYASLKRNSELKEVFIVRYADDFKLFTRSYKEAVRLKRAVEQWLENNLHLETSPEKSGITNLKEKYTDFLGFKMKVRKKSNKYVVRSHMSDKAFRIQIEKLKEQIRKIIHSGDSKQIRAIKIYNSKVIGLHNYYRLATDINEDVDKIGWKINKMLYNRILNRFKCPKRGKLDPNSYIGKTYGKSKQIRFFRGLPLVPVGYCQTKNPMCKKRNESRFTPEGREKLHQKLGVDLTVIRELMECEITAEHSIEYYDNRISLYCAQRGKCAVTGRYLTSDEIHCHHKKPIKNGGGDEYSNLVILHKDVHRLVHATRQEAIDRYLNYITDEKMLRKLNKLRVMTGNTEIIKEFCK